MTEFKEGGKCSICGAPIWYPTVWDSVIPPPPMFTCGHFGIHYTVTDNTTGKVIG